MGRYSKFIVAFVGFLVSILSIYFKGAEWLPALVAFLTSIGVYAIPNQETK